MATINLGADPYTSLYTTTNASKGDTTGDCYNPNREGPEWLSWLPTINETLCMIGITKPSGVQNYAPPPSAPFPSASGAAQPEMMGSTNSEAAALWTPVQAATEGQIEANARTAEIIQNWQDQVAATGGTHYSLSGSTWLILAAGAAVLLLVATRR